MTTFTPVESLIGGLLIGLSAMILMHGIGRIAGISGIVGGLLARQPRYEIAWRIAFLTGMLIAAYAINHINPSLIWIDANLPMEVNISTSPWIIVIAGILVGYGTRLGSGCTSGHGVCGIGRFSKRSIVATMIFMGTAAITVFISKTLSGA